VESECGCAIDDLCPCAGPCDECVPARDGVPVALLDPTPDERIERKLREALTWIEAYAEDGRSDVCVMIEQIARAALDYVPEKEDMEKSE